MPDCGDNSCRYAARKGGMRTNGGCRCDTCPKCGAIVRPNWRTCTHYEWCPQRDWVPEHHRVDTNHPRAGARGDKQEG